MRSSADLAALASAARLTPGTTSMSPTYERLWPAIATLLAKGWTARAAAQWCMQVGEYSGSLNALEQAISRRLRRLRKAQAQHTAAA